MMIPLVAAATVATAPAAGAAVEPRAANAATARAACSALRSQVLFDGRVNASNRIVLTLRVRSDRPRPAWDVRISRDAAGNRPIFQSREFAARVGLRQQRSFEVGTRTANRPGPDRFVARAVHVASGEVCRVAITVRGNNAADWLGGADTRALAAMLWLNEFLQTEGIRSAMELLACKKERQSDQERHYRE
jgi:hypothetical protein